MKFDDGLEELEYKNLQGAVAEVEVFLAYAAPGARVVYEAFLSNAKLRLHSLKTRIEEQKAEAEHQEREQKAIAVLAEQETALNAHEREEYSSFLKEEFFTKKDFGKLEQFYLHTYDRLSEGGKEEMSHRIWEGVRRDEYRFTDLPQIVQEKEADRVYHKLINPDRMQDSLQRILEGDQTDFIRAYEAGKREEARKVLTRDSFRQNVSLETATGVKHAAVTIGRAVDDHGVLADTPSRPPAATPPETSAMTKVSQTAKALQGVTLADTASPPATIALPNALTPGVNGRSPA